MLEDFRKYIEAAVETLSPAKAQRLAKGLLEPGARKEQVAKAAQDLVEWSQRNRDRMKGFVAREVKDQLKAVGVATQADLDAVKKRVRELERAAGVTASGRSASKTTASRTSTRKRPAARAAAGGKTSKG